MSSRALVLGIALVCMLGVLRQLSGTGIGHGSGAVGAHPRRQQRWTPAWQRAKVPVQPIPAASAAAAAPSAQPLSRSKSRRRGSSAAASPSRRGVTLRMGDIGDIRLLLRPEWSGPSAVYAMAVATAPAARQSSNVYRLEPGFLIQGRLTGSGVAANTDNSRAPKVMERGEVGWAGGSKGPDYFIYLGTGPATWLGNPHDGTIWADVADEESMAVAANVSTLPLGRETQPGQMHIMAKPVKVLATLWIPSSRSESIDHPTLDILKIAGTTLDSSAAACAPPCHAQAHTELHGDVVRWGSDFRLDSASACCEACREHAASGKQGKLCNVWVYCSNPKMCGKASRQCWLKHAKAIWSDRKLLVGTSDRWTAGTLDAPPADHPSGAGRRAATAADADLRLVIGVGGAASPRELSVRLMLREATPRAAKRVRAALPSLAALGACATDACASIHGGAPVPRGWGSESTADGVGHGERWPRGEALLWGTLGASCAPGPNATLPIESDPVPVRRGSMGWAGTDDGPHFFIALADSPQLGVSFTIFAEVATEDLHTLDTLAETIAARGESPPLPLALLPLGQRPLVDAAAAGGDAAAAGGDATAGGGDARRAAVIARLRETSSRFCCPSAPKCDSSPCVACEEQRRLLAGGAAAAAGEPSPLPPGLFVDHTTEPLCPSHRPALLAFENVYDGVHSLASLEKLLGVGVA